MQVRWDAVSEDGSFELDWGLVDSPEAPFSLAGLGDQKLEGIPRAPDYGSFDDFTREAYASGV